MHFEVGELAEDLVAILTLVHDSAIDSGQREGQRLVASFLLVAFSSTAAD